MAAAGSGSGSTGSGSGSGKPKSGGSSDYVFIIDDQTVCDGRTAAIQSVCLPHPKYADVLARYLLIGNGSGNGNGNDQLLSIECVKDPPCSWFAGDAVISDGSLYLCTRTDPLFLAVQPLIKARNKV